MIWINALEEEEPRRPAYHYPLPAKSTFGEMRASEIPQDDLRNLVRVISACTLGLWAFAAGLLIGVFLFS